MDVCQKIPAMTARQQLHTTVYSQSFSPCGKFLVTADNFGHMCLFSFEIFEVQPCSINFGSLPAVLGPDATDKSRKPVFRFKGHDGPIYTLTSTERYLISAGTGDIRAWKWTDIITKAPRVIWALPIHTQSKFDSPEVNSIVVNDQGGTSHLVAGCGDNVVHTWDIEASTELRSLEGHTDYIHQVALRSNGGEIVSVSEDGSARIWDVRDKVEAHRVEPFTNESCVRHKLGKWLGCVAVDGDWLVCGGGPHLSMWHLRSLTCTSIFHTQRTAHQHVMFHEDSVISAGSEPWVYHWAVNGVEKSHVPSTPTSVFNVSVNNTQDESTKVLSVVGNSPSVDVCTNFGYKALSLSVF